MPKRSLSDLVLDTIDTISARKNRPNLARIYRHLHRLYDLSLATCESLLQALLKEGKVIRVTYKGNISYRNALKWKKYSYYMKKNMELPGTLLTSAISELIVKEPDYLNTGVPWNILEHHLLSVKDENINRDTLGRLLQRELKLESMSQLENGNYFLGPKPVKARTMENTTLKFEPVKKNIASETINLLPIEKVSNTTYDEQRHSNFENNNTNDGSSFKSEEFSFTGFSACSDSSESQEFVINEESSNGCTTSNGIEHSFSGHKYTIDDNLCADNEVEINTSNEVEIPACSQETDPYEISYTIQSDNSESDGEVINQNYTSKIKSSEINNDITIKNADTKCVLTNYSKQKMEVSNELNHKRNVEVGNQYRIEVYVNGEHSSKGNNEGKKSSPMGINKRTKEPNLTKSVKIDDIYNSSMNTEIDNTKQNVKVNDDSSDNDVIIGDSPTFSNVDTSNSCTTQEKLSDNDDVAEEEEENKNVEMQGKEITSVSGRVRRTKKTKYDASDYYFPSLKRKTRDSTGEQDKKEDKRKKKKKKEATPSGIFAKRVMFPGNRSMCCECKCYVSKIKVDPVITCVSCSNKGHQSCASKFMRESDWFCIDCRQDVEQCKICKKQKNEENLGILHPCDHCGSSYHKMCHVPSIQDTSSKWHCFRCPPLEVIQPEESASSVDSCDPEKQKLVEPTSLPPETENKQHSYFHEEPPDPTNWTTKEVYAYFRKYFEENVAQTILQNNIDGYSLKMLDRNDILKLDFKLGVCLKLLIHIKRLQLQSNNFTKIWKS